VSALRGPDGSAGDDRRPVDVILEDFVALAMRGRIAVIGNRGSIEINPRLAMNKNAAILGVALFHASSASLSASARHSRRGWATARCSRSSSRGCRSPRLRVPTRR
jgi:hypothetical protein